LIQPRLNLGETAVHQSSDEIVTVLAGDRSLGEVGIIWTSRVALEGFLWYSPNEKPRGREVAEMRRALNEWIEKVGAKVWMVVKRDDKMLRSWARFMGFTLIGPHDEKHDKYVRN